MKTGGGRPEREFSQKRVGGGAFWVFGFEFNELCGGEEGPGKVIARIADCGLPSPISWLPALTTQKIETASFKPKTTLFDETASTPVFYAAGPPLGEWDNWNRVGCLGDWGLPGRKC